jgi:hypothetical protein
MGTSAEEVAAMIAEAKELAHQRLLESKHANLQEGDHTKTEVDAPQPNPEEMKDEETQAIETLKVLEEDPFFKLKQE